ncbi:Crp/Fnr family transcriptional regulator [uncultured Fibrella sp.]|uniref:Crp/Fnr family transcriptional regulator n=1 Tax=uncultured Fibrella sp. TaxID=1284596 RepID=UPI0035CAAB49
MDKKSLVTFIQSNSRATSEVVDYIASFFDEKVIPRHDYLLRAGAISDDYFFLTEGFLRVFTLDADGNEVTTYFYSSNRAVFDVSSLFMRIPSTENIQALAVCKGYCISFDTLNKLFHSLPEFREFGRLMLVKEFAAFKQRTLALINKSAEERYLDLIGTNKEVFQHAQLKQIASYLGITDTSLSRIRRDLSKKK